MTTTENTVELLTTKEVARRLRCAEITVTRWIKGGELDAITLPNRGKRHIYRVRKSTLDGLLAEKGGKA